MTLWWPKSYNDKNKTTITTMVQRLKHLVSFGVNIIMSVLEEDEIGK
jgi:hypothetical protein